MAAAGVCRHERQLEPQQRADHPAAFGPGGTGAVRDGARVAVRAVRRDGMGDIKTHQKKHDLSEDDIERWSDEVQKLTDQYIKRVDESLAEKERDIRQV